MKMGIKVGYLEACIFLVDWESRKMSQGDFVF